MISIMLHKKLAKTILNQVQVHPRNNLWRSVAKTNIRHQQYERLVPLGIMEEQLRVPLKPPYFTALYRIEGYKGGPSLDHPYIMAIWYRESP